jgi:hypothetical protein
VFYRAFCGYYIEQVIGHRRQGKQQLCWLDSIKDATGLHLQALKETEQGRNK